MISEAQEVKPTIDKLEGKQQHKPEKGVINGLTSLVVATAILLPIFPVDASPKVDYLAIKAVDNEQAINESGPFVVSPSRGVPGKIYDLLIQAKDCTKELGTKLTKSKLRIPQGSGVVLKPDTTKFSEDGCSISATVAIDQDAPLGTIKIQLIGDDGRLIGTTDFAVREKPPGAIPTEDPQVDVMWSVIPNGIVKDNFGRNVGNNYYCIEIAIGNNSGYDLLLGSIGFDLTKSSSALLATIQHKIPVASYKLTRGTLEKGQEVGVRNKTINIIKAMGPVLTGITPFFSSMNRKDFAEGVNIFSNPFEKGAELVFPDTTIGQLRRLDDQTLRDNLVISNNTQIVSKVFVPKKLLALSEPRTLPKTTDQGSSEYKQYIKELNDYDNYRMNKDQPAWIMKALGELVLIGDKIQHINRVRLNAPPDTTPVPPTLEADQKSIIQGQEVTFQFSGKNLTNASLILPSGLELTDKVINVDDRSFKAKIKALDNAKPGQFNIKVETSGGKADVPIEIKPGIPSGLAIVTSIRALAAMPRDREYEISITGSHLDKATVVPDGNSPLKISDIHNLSTAGEIKLKVTVLAATPAKTYNLVVKNSDDSFGKVDFIVENQPPPVVTSKQVVDEDLQENPGKDKEFTLLIKGENLEDAELIRISSSPFVILSNESISGSLLKSRLRMKQGTKTGEYTLKLMNHNPNSDTVEFKLKVEPQPEPVLTNNSGRLNPDVAPNGTTDQETKLIIEGKHLQGRRLSPVQGNPIKIKDSIIRKEEGERHFVTIVVPKATPPGIYKFNVEGSNSNKSLTIEVTLQ